VRSTPDRKPPRRITPRYLENAALAHLKKFSATAAQLRSVLLRKIDRSLRVHGGDRDVHVRAVDALLQSFTEKGYLHDERVARSKADSMRAAGKSTRAIAMKLRQKGVAAEVVDAQIARVRDEVSDLDAARVLARKKRLGPHRPSDEVRRAHRQRDLATLARAGFSFDVAKRVIDE
jgi:regulatory protein